MYVFFDFDGTLVKSDAIHYQIWQELSTRFGVLNPLEYSSIVGVPAREIARNHFYSDDIDEVIEQFDIEEMIRDYIWVKGAEAFTQNLFAKGHRLAIVTNSRHAKVSKSLSAKGLVGIFETIISSDDVKMLKPNPEPYCKAMEYFGCNPSDVIVFEDSSSGIRSAKDCGLHVISVDPENIQDLNDWYKLWNKNIQI